MKKEKILKRIADGKITPQEGYIRLYGRRSPKAKFVRLSMELEKHPMMNVLFAMIFALPIPLGCLKLIPRKVFGNEDLNKEELIELVKYAKGTNVEIISNEANILIYII